MSKHNDLILDLSILYRSTSKYYDRQLKEMNLTYAQLPILILIYENEGSSMQVITNKGGYDKGTISKSIRHLEQEGYIRVVPSKKDKRNKEIYTTNIAKQSMSKVYEIRRDWWKHLTKDIEPEELDHFISLYQTMAINALAYADTQPVFIHFYEWQKLSLSEYPNHFSSILRMGGCNFQCPHCTKSNLVFMDENEDEIPLETIYDFLEDRKDTLDALCIEGGEPFMHKNLSIFLNKVKEFNYKIKIKTNGSYPDELKQVIRLGLVDYVELNLKNGPNYLAQTIGMTHYDSSKIKESIDYLIQGSIPYTFSIRLVEEFHNTNSILDLAKWIEGAKKIILNTKIDENKTFKSGFHSVTKQKARQFSQILAMYVDSIEIGD